MQGLSSNVLPVYVILKNIEHTVFLCSADRASQYLSISVSQYLSIISATDKLKAQILVLQ